MMKAVLLVLIVVGLVNGAPRKVPRLDGRIIGGSPVDIKNFPYQVSMRFLGSHICGAVNIAPFYMVTAGHCVDGTWLVYTTVRVGSSFHASDGLIIPVERLHLHPLYDSWDIDYDIGILELSLGLGSGVGVSSIALPRQGQVFPAGTPTIVTGWGTTEEGASDIPDQLQAVNVPIVDNEACNKYYNSTDIITPQMICAGVPQGGFDACQGDSGGPLVTENFILVGLVSWGYGCARPEYPGVYTNVASLRDYIKEITHI